MENGRRFPPPPPWLPVALGAAVLVIAVLWALFARDEGTQVVVEGDSTARAAEAESTAERDPMLRGGIREFERTVAARLPALSTARLRGGVSVELERVRWDDPAGRRFLSASRATGVLNADAMGRGEIVVDNVSLRDADVLLSKPSTTARWNYERIFDTGSGGGATRLMAFRDVRIENGRARIELPQGTYVLTGVAGRLPLAELTAPGGRERRIDVAQLTGALTLPDSAAPVRVMIADATFQVGDEVLGFDVAHATWGDGRLADVRGAWAFADGVAGIRAAGRVESIRLADVRGFAPALPEEGTASFAFLVEPLGSARMRVSLSDLEASTEGSNVFGSLSVVLGGAAPPQFGALDLRVDPLRVDLIERFTGPIPYDGAIRGTVRGPPTALRFDVVADLRADAGGARFQTRLVGTAALAESGFTLASVDARLDDVPLSALALFIPGLPLEGLVSGRVRLTGPPGKAPMQVDVELAVAGGRATLVGIIDTRGGTASYDLRGSLTGVRMDALFEPTVPPVALTASYAARGSGGFALETANARVELFGRFTGWRTGPRDTIGLRLTLSDGTLDLDTLATRVGPLSVAAGGTWRLVEPASGGIRYVLAVRSLGEVAPFLPADSSRGGSPVSASGSIRAVGAVSGPLNRLRFGGTLEGRDFRYGEWAAESLQGEYAYLPGGAYPEADLNLTASEVTTPTAGKFETIRIDGRLANQTFRLAANGVRTGGGGIEVALDGQLDRESGGRAVIRSLAADLKDQRWALADTAVVAWGGPGFGVHNFVVRQANGPGEVRIDGRIPPTGGSDLDVGVRGLPVADLMGLLGRQVDVTGLLSGDANIRGSRDAPRVSATFTLDGGSINDVALTQANGSLRFGAGVTAIEAALRLRDGGSMTIDGAIPSRLTIGFPPQFAVDSTAPVHARMDADQLALGVFAELSPQVRDVTGAMNGSVTLRGTLREPSFTGQFNLERGELTLVPLDQRFREITADIGLNGREIVIRQLRARSDGVMEATGTVTLEDLSNPRVALDVRLTDFEPIGAEDVDGAGFSGTIEVEGPLDALVMGGRLEVEDGTIPLSTFIRGDRLLTQQVAELTEAEADPNDPLVQPPGPPSWWEGMSLDGLVVAVREGVWFSTKDVRARLDGDLTIYKDAEAVRIFGELQGNQGTFALTVGPMLVRRFQIERANVRFFGLPEPDPALDVTASRIVLDPEGGHRLQVLVNVTGTASAPALSLSTPEGATLPESELLNVLVFGTETTSLTGSTGYTGVPLVEDIFFGGLADYVGMKAEESLIEDVGIPIDFFLLRTPPGELEPSAVFGKQLTNDVFLTVETGVASQYKMWSISLDWQIDRQWGVELSLEPLRSRRYFRGVQVPSYELREGRQVSLDLRRRWTY